ncbi:MAG: hypothetical protein QGG89_16820, partial [Vicinamibacterales bacterium]|nr:hypothetical protein [Vicinamibacterales bacterium]
LWLVGTIGHFGLTAHWVRRFDLAGSSHDESWFVTMLAATGTLSLVLHGVASSVGLGLASVLAPLAAGHGLLAIVARRRQAPTRETHQTSTLTPEWLTQLLEGAATIALSAMVVAWLVMGSETMAVRGTDAAHYHVPVAVNLALGASPLDLPTTQHLYPMGASTLAAWFLLPVGDPLLVDLVTLVPFLLTVASLGWMFRLVTGESGLAWCTWLTLAVFSTPLFHETSLMSADLLFGATFVALTAQLLSMTLGARRSLVDILLIGLGTGLLIGSKTTGLPAAALLLGLAAAAFLFLHWRHLGQLSVRLVWAWTAAGLLAVGAGGVWLIRNWWLFGSPVAPTGLSLFGIEIFRGIPLEPSTNLSVLGDLEANPEYALASRVSTYITEQMGRWYLLLFLALFLVPLDALTRWWQGRSGGLPRVLLLVAVLGTGVPMIWLLIGAPWTSLEWTRGGALRYVLPWLLLLSLLAWIGLFPAGVPWYRRPAVAATLGGIVVTTSLVMTLQGQTNPPFPPAATWPAVLVSVGVWLAIRFVHDVARYAALAVVCAGLVASAAWITERDAVARDESRAARASISPTPTQQLYAAVLRAEDTLAVGCKYVVHHAALGSRDHGA